MKPRATTTSVAVRLPHEHYLLLLQLAEAREMTPAQYLAHVVERHYIRMHSQPETQPQRPPREVTPRPKRAS